MLSSSKKIRKYSQSSKITATEILKSHLFPCLPALFYDLILKDKALKSVFIMNFSDVLSKNLGNEVIIFDEFRSQYSNWLEFLLKTEENLTDAETKFKQLLSAIARSFPLKTEVFQLIILCVGFLLNTEKASLEQLKKIVKKTIYKVLKMNEMFRNLKANLGKLNKTFIGKIVDLLLEWKEFFQS